MEVISRTSSTLNPNAPCFVPSVYRQVEDFSDEWWELVNSDAYFSDYWLQECFEDPQSDEYSTDDSVFLPDIESVFDGYSKQDEADEKEKYYRELVTLSALKWRRSRGVTETAPKYFEKAPKFVNLKVNPRPIQQPR